MIDYQKLQKSLKHLEVQFANWQRAKDRPELTDLDREAIGESVIQRFEVCYDTLWKTLRRYLIEEMGLADVQTSPKAVLKLAGQNDLLPGLVGQWLLYADARTSTSHDYSGEKAQQCLGLMNEFVNHAIDLFQTMNGQPWK